MSIFSILFFLVWRFHDGAAMFAGAMLQVTEEAVEHRRELGLDVREVEVFLVELGVASLAEPQQAILLIR